MLDRENTVTDNIQKLNENDLEKVSGGKWTDIKDVSSFFRRNRIATSCSNCHRVNILKINKSDIDYCFLNKGYDKVWKCKYCNRFSHTIACSDKLSSGSYGPWYGRTR